MIEWILRAGWLDEDKKLFLRRRVSSAISPCFLCSGKVHGGDTVNAASAASCFATALHSHRGRERDFNFIAAPFSFFRLRALLSKNSPLIFSYNPFPITMNHDDSHFLITWVIGTIHESFQIICPSNA